MADISMLLRCWKPKSGIDVVQKVPITWRIAGKARWRHMGFAARNLLLHVVHHA
jgi:hypothetical protein